MSDHQQPPSASQTENMPVLNAPTINAPLMYTDAVASVALGVHVTRLVFGMHEGVPKDGKQPMSPNLIVVMPTQSVLDFCNNFLLNFSGATDQLLKADDAYRSKALEIAKRFVKK